MSLGGRGRLLPCPPGSCHARPVTPHLVVGAGSCRARPRLNASARCISAWLVVLSVLLSGCLGVAVPTQQHPVCSWDSAVPSDADALCARVFDTLSTVVRAEASGNNATIHRIVINPRVARSVIAWGAGLRRQGLKELHVVPTLTLRTVRPGYIGTGFDIFARTISGHVTAPQTVELHVLPHRLVIVNDQPGQDW